MKKSVWFTLTFLSAIMSSQFSNGQRITTFAGLGVYGYTGDGGPATAARMHSPSHMVFNKKGELFFTDYSNHCVRKIDTAGIIKRVAGTTTPGFSGDGGPATACRFNGPHGISIDKWGNLYIADPGNNRVRKMDTSGIITTVAGTGTAGFGGDGGPATAATFAGCTGVYIDTSGNIYVADMLNSRIRKINTTGVVTTIAGNSTAGFSGDWGPATLASLNNPTSLTMDASGNIYIADQLNHRVRKIDPSGIITTVAGNGSGGYAGDGGAALAAQLNNPADVKFDGLGNMMIGDAYNNVIRMVNGSGTISTIAGNGTAGYSGDGGPATAAKLSRPWGMGFDPLGNLYIGDIYNYVIRKIKFAPDYISDSFQVRLDQDCHGLHVIITPEVYAAGMYVKTFYGDGKHDSVTVSPTGGAAFNHFYASSGAYTIRHVLYNSAGPIDTFRYTFNFLLCNDLPVAFYYEGNSNCIKDATEPAIYLPLVIGVDRNGVRIDTIPATSGLTYKAYGSVGDVYRFTVLSSPPGLSVVCPSSGIITDTLKSADYVAGQHYYGFECSSGAGQDLQVYTYFTAGRHHLGGHILVNNTYCAPVPATLTMQLSPKFNTSLNFAPNPASVVANTVTWNLGAVSSMMPKPLLIIADMETPGAWLMPGDTAITRYIADPVSTDVNPSDNIVIRCDTVRSGYDPNDIAVSPAGCIPPTTSTLRYTIHFENTGNDTAFNIHVLDTLPAQVDPRSVRIVATSAQMNTSIIKMSGYNIVKFDFPGINLLDSSHHGLSGGMVLFDVNLKSGLASGTSIFNRAGIYFDVNPVVLTNTAVNMFDCPTAITEINKAGTAEVYPNPASNELTIKMELGAFSSVTISNSMGQLMMQQQLDGTQAHVDIKMLPPGLYYVALRGEGGSVVKNVVKE